jgi:hypothetical protein
MGCEQCQHYWWQNLLLRSFLSNNLELGLWQNASPSINQIGVDTQNEVVKEEKDCVLTTNRMETF